MGLRHDGSYSIYDKFVVVGEFQFSQGAVATDKRVEVSTMLQKNYSMMERQVVSLSKEEALALAAAITKHFEGGE